MKISVIVPFWNSEKWLGVCCESLISQEGDFDFILVDDKSTDNSREIAYEYCMKDSRFMLMTNFRTKGVSGARNTGLEYACQEKGWITFLDADDELLDNAYQMFMSAIESDERANVHQFNSLRYYPQIDKTVLKYTNLTVKEICFSTGFSCESVFCNAFRKKHRMPDILFVDLTVRFLDKFEQFLQQIPNQKDSEKKLNRNTILNNMKRFRTLTRRPLSLDT